jgi:hypothetical protein
MSKLGLVGHMGIEIFTTLHVSGASAHHQEYLKLVRRPLVLVLSLQVSHHISLLGPELNACWEGIQFRP